MSKRTAAEIAELLSASQDGEVCNLAQKVISDDDIEHIVNYLQQNPGVKFLDLSGNNITEEGAKKLAKNDRLLGLNLSENLIGDEGAAAFATNTTLLGLGLRYCGVNSKGAIALAENSTLVELDLSFNCIGNSGAIPLAKNQTIQGLDLSDCRIHLNFMTHLADDDIAADAFVALAENKKITCLALKDTTISKAGVIAFKANETLTVLTLGGFNNNSHDTTKELYEVVEKNNLANNILTHLKPSGNIDDISEGLGTNKEIYKAFKENNLINNQHRLNALRMIIILLRAKNGKWAKSTTLSITDLPTDLLPYFFRHAYRGNFAGVETNSLIKLMRNEFNKIESWLANKEKQKLKFVRHNSMDQYSFSIFSENKEKDAVQSVSNELSGLKI